MKSAFIASLVFRPGFLTRTTSLPKYQRACHFRNARAGMRTRMCSAKNQTKAVKEPTMVRARHILVESEEMVDAIKQQIEEGKGNFAELAGLVSTCASKDRGGDLGWFRRHTMVKEFEEAAFSNPPGSVVKVKSEFGWHLVKVEDHGIASKAITVDEYAKRFGKNGSHESSDVQLIDCREVGELELASLPNFLNLPMGEYGSWAADFESGNLGLEKDKETIVMCHHGVRSANFCSFLSQQGFTNVRNLIGGIDAYSRKIDPSVPQY